MRQVDEDRFADFVRAQSASLFRAAYLMTGDYQRAEDLLQATLVRLYQRWRVWQAVLTLPPRQRAVTVLRYYENHDLGPNRTKKTLYMPDWEREWGIARLPLTE